MSCLFLIVKNHHDEEVAVLQARRDHPDVDPAGIFTRHASASYPSWLVRHLLSLRYETRHGDIEPNDPIFLLAQDARKLGDKVMVAVYDRDGHATIFARIQ